MMLMQAGFSARPVGPSVSFAAKKKGAAPSASLDKNLEKFKALRDELVAKFPGGPMRYSNGSGIGLLNRGQGKSELTGIAVYHATDADRNIVVNYLLRNQLIQTRPDGAYEYKGTPVGFQVIGEVRVGG